MTRAGLTSAAGLLVLLGTAAAAAELQIQNNNNPGEGFNDATSANPTGLNFGTTRGDQALIVFQTAACIWGATVQSSVPIVVDSAFISATDDSRFACTSEGAVLGYARLAAYETAPTFPNPQAGYVVALANALTGLDETPGKAHILARFNGDLGTAACPQLSWSFALEGEVDGGSQVSMVNTVLHELGHGLGYVSFVTPTTGDLSGNPPSIFDFHLFDVDAGTSWANESVTARETLAKMPAALGFDGEAVRAAIPLWLGYAPELLVTAQGAAAVALQFVPGEFSGPLTGSGPLALASPLDACTDLAAGSLTGTVAVIVRGGTDPSDPNGSCTFIAKSSRAAAAGAIGVIIFNNVASPPYVRMAGSPAIAIPAVFVSQTDGQTLQAQVTAGPVDADFTVSSQRSNTDPTQTRVLLYTPTTVVPASSVSHWNDASYPQALLMEPFIESDMRLDMDFTPEVMADLGWSVVRGLSVSVVKALEPTVPLGGNARYIIAVLNRRATAVAGVTLDLSFSAGGSVVSAEGACTGFPCALGSMEQGAVKLVVATVRVPGSPSDPFPVTASLTPASPDAEDNLSATVSTPVASGGDLQVTVTGPSQVSAGASATFTVTVTNAGPGTATGVTVSREATAGATGIQVSGGGGGCVAGNCTFATLGPNASQSLSSAVAVPAGFNGEVTVSATVTSATPDPNPANNTASATASTATAPAGKSGCSATGEPVTALGMAAVALALLRRRRWARANS